MGSGKHSNSDDTSSEDLELDQIDDQGKVSEDDNDDDDGTTGGVSRSYGCTFCKRGFTNAQALGGHMNIHRKDKAKSKSKQQKNNNHRRHQESSSSTWLSNKSHTSVSSQYAAASVGAYMNNYHQAGYFPASNYNNPSRYNNNHHYDFMMTTSPGTAAVPDDQRLSLRIGSTPTTRNKEEDEDGEDRLIDIDLELRLGH